MTRTKAGIRPPKQEIEDAAARVRMVAESEARRICAQRYRHGRFVLSTWVKAILRVAGEGVKQ